ncbi:allophanate hydrolase [Lentibacillus kapialis]|uniref:Allophanate hydrolase n=1 Tax=Lentibacillus kapialis TaxID=340214 RepID=A0A917V183_9BACI|nr:5-oxoprolinase subunit PxpB [Lentibacillus kapialis]GGK07680.1 allophanate hydrolase [Lentibacillus kapialis]
MSFFMQAVGDSAVKIQFQDDVTPSLNRRIQLFSRKLYNHRIEGVVEWVPAYDSLTVYYQPHQIRYRDLCQKLDQVFQLESEANEAGGGLITIPVVYGGDNGPDLERVAAVNELSADDVITLHTRNTYLVYMLGFLPGFPYLGGLDKRIATSRLEEPRGKISAGSVGIAHEQTGIYPIESPGGWNIIGKTPIQLFDVHKENAFLLRPGDEVRFSQIDETDYKMIEQQISDGTFKIGTVIKDAKLS